MISFCVAHYKENLDWICNVNYRVDVISKQEYKEDEAPNKGNEASSYLEYIIKHYDNLSDYNIFVHGHRNSWHHNENMDDRINRLVFDKEYYNLNENTMCTFGNNDMIIYRMIDDIAKILNTKINPYHLWFTGSAQFYVCRNNILKHSKQTYIELYSYLMNTKETSEYSGRAFEFIWHFIFTGSHTEIINLEDVKINP